MKCVTFLVVLVSLAAQAVHAQQPPCRTCRVTIAKVAELSSERALITPSTDVSIATVGGEYFVSHRFQQPVLLRYDRNGTFLNTYDRKGRGPGELNSAPRLFVRHDTLVALDDNRLIHFVGLQHVRTSTTKARIGSAALLPDGRFVVTGTGVPKGHVRVITPDTTHVDIMVDSATPDGVALLVSPGAAGRVWVSRSNGSATWAGDITSGSWRALSTPRRWFEPWTGTVTGEPLTVAPRPRVMDVVDVNPQLLLAVFSVADSNWVSLGPPGREIQFRPGEVDWNALFDVVFEFIHPNTGAVLARGRHSALLRRVTGSADLFYALRQTSNGHVIADIWRVQMSE